MQATNGILIGWASRNVTPDQPVNLMGQFHVRIATAARESTTERCRNAFQRYREQ